MLICKQKTSLAKYAMVVTHLNNKLHYKHSNFYITKLFSLNLSKIKQMNLKLLSGLSKGFEMNLRIVVIQKQEKK